MGKYHQLMKRGKMIFKKYNKWSFLIFEFFFLMYVGFRMGINYEAIVVLVLVVLLEPFVGRRINRFLLKIKFKIPETLKESCSVNGLMILAWGIGAFIRGI